MSSSPALSHEDILQLSFQQLRNECKKVELSAGGSTQALRKRLQDHFEQQHCSVNNQYGSENNPTKRGRDDEEEAPSKRSKKSPADDLICPITLELTWDPVTAEDGQVYEKEAIEKHFQTQRANGAALKSPVTNKPMGERLLTSHRQKSLIETLIDTGVIQGDLVSVWNKKMEEAKAMEVLQQKANAGDLKAIGQLARNYRYGLKGFKENKVLAFQWFQKGHDGGCFRSTSLLGSAFFVGAGVTKCKQQGIMYTAIAAAQGSDFAAMRLGLHLAEGNGIPQNKNEAIRWLKKALSPDCPLRHRISKEFKGRAKEKLVELESEIVNGNQDTEGATATA